MRRKKLSRIIPGILLPLVVLGVLLCFLSGISNISRGHSAEDKLRLEEVLRQAAVSCYATEGFYPPNLEYLEEHYGVRINGQNFTVRYTAVADNIMPDITVLEN